MANFSAGTIPGAVADAISAATTILIPKATNLVIREFPVMKVILDAWDGKYTPVDMNTGTVIFNVVKSAPGVATNLDASNVQPIASPIQTISTQGYASVGRTAWAYSITDDELIQAWNAQALQADKGAVENITMNKTVYAIQEWKKQLTMQLTTGVPDSAYGQQGFLTWNGQQNYTLRGTSYSGVFEFAAPASQTATVSGIPKKGAASGAVANWYNQYGLISSFATDGIIRLQQVVGLALREGALLQFATRELSLFSSEAMFRNYLNTLADDVRYITKEEYDKGTYAYYDGIEAIHYGPHVWYMDDTIDVSKFSSPGSNGVMYIINPKSWLVGMIEPGAPAGVVNFGTLKKLEKLFTHTGLTLSDYHRRIWSEQIMMNAGIFPINLRANGLIAGGDQA